MRRRTFLAVPALGAAASLLDVSAASASPAVMYSNPLIARRADPHIFRHTDGYYYFTATAPEYDRIILRRATTLQGLASASESVIWRKHASGDMGAHIWAPEIHFINGKWYIYFAAGRSNDIWRIRMWVLENSSADPFTGTWVEKGRIVTHLDTFSLDATTFSHNGIRYLSWAQQDPAISGNSNLYLAPMSNPWTISGTPVRLSVPTLSWETIGYKVNEGPSALIRNGKVFLTYSASATDSNYCLGMLTASASSNLMNPASWSKKQQPVFRTNTATSQYGPGHNSFTVSEDGQSDILVYHDRSYRDISGDPLNDPNRRTRIQKLYWNADGTPNFGTPVPDGATPYRFRSYNFPDRFIRHVSFRGRIDADMTNLAESQFRMVTGLAGSGTVSLESTSNPGYYLRNRNNEIWLDKNDGTTGFKNGASFTRRAGQSDPAAVSFESMSAPGRYLRHYNYALYAQPLSTAADLADATFYLE
ncbi:family 43 glycosylhydrolase [Micromonospora sp. KC213]|uniref:family 43 glycosylhydrolase n=1 Tax=Micromonospora sp. KC213 TaxID=2530378 RepID=UPI00104D8B83|nr:family 43 glycosylhydrolase [Micromonospora sp. KC213]TDC41023.1 alpha-arabinofuranosidase [Micromonospora sp. KC213]